MSIAEELREWANENAEYHYSLAHDRGTCMHRDTADTFTDILEHGWPERIQAELDKKDALIARLQDMLDGARERYKEDSDRLGKKDAEIAALRERLGECSG